jgi:hypothetical protein
MKGNVAGIEFDLIDPRLGRVNESVPGSEENGKP